MSKPKPRTAFPARTNAMGYQDGLTKLEWMTVLIYCNTNCGIELAIEKAQEILKACETAEKAD